MRTASEIATAIGHADSLRTVHRRLDDVADHAASPVKVISGVRTTKLGGDAPVFWFDPTGNTDDSARGGHEIGRYTDIRDL